MTCPLRSVTKCLAELPDLPAGKTRSGSLVVKMPHALSDRQDTRTYWPSELARLKRSDWNRHLTARRGKNTSKDSTKATSRPLTCSNSYIVRRSADIATSVESQDEETS